MSPTATHHDDKDGEKATKAKAQLCEWMDDDDDVHITTLSPQTRTGIKTGKPKPKPKPPNMGGATTVVLLITVVLLDFLAAGALLVLCDVRGVEISCMWSQQNDK